MAGDQANRHVHVLVKEQGGGLKVVAVYADKEQLLARIERMARANPQYPMRSIGKYENCWTIGPDEDEGFFGNKPVTLRAYEAPLWEREG